MLRVFPCLQLLAEYLLSRQLDEAAACVKELDCSLFHHEIVKRAVKVGGVLQVCASRQDKSTSYSDPWGMASQSAAGSAVALPIVISGWD